MGEYAEDMIEGRACSQCGQYFIDPENEDQLYEHGHPAVCSSCWSGLSKEARKFHEKAVAETL